MGCGPPCGEDTLHTLPFHREIQNVTMYSMRIAITHRGLSLFIFLPAAKNKIRSGIGLGIKGERLQRHWMEMKWSRHTVIDWRDIRLILLL